jgi:hypothetical protein
VDLLPLSRGGISSAVAIAVEESDSAAGQVLLFGGADEEHMPVSTVQLVDLATGACVPQDNLLHRRFGPAAGRLTDGRIVWRGASVVSCWRRCGHRRSRGRQMQHGAGETFPR